MAAGNFASKPLCSPQDAYCRREAALSGNLYLLQQLSLGSSGRYRRHLVDQEQYLRMQLRSSVCLRMDGHRFRLASSGTREIHSLQPLRVSVLAARAFGDALKDSLVTPLAILSPLWLRSFDPRLPAMAQLVESDESRCAETCTFQELSEAPLHCLALDWPEC